jgi:hypothetical protein
MIDEAVELVRKIGTPPDHPAFVITPETRQWVMLWAIRQGFCPERIESARDSTLQKLYSNANFRRQLMTRGDYNPSVAKKETTPTQEPRQTQRPPQTDAEVLAAAIQNLAGGISEARVIELIHQHVPAIIRQAFRE